jgi:hydroxymethylbilane synthase
MVPAVGQGALGIETRSGDEDVLRFVATLGHEPTAVCCTAERAFLAAMGGGCAVPIAGHATVSDGRLTMVGAVGDEELSSVRRFEVTGDPGDAEAAGRDLAARFR